MHRILLLLASVFVMRGGAVVSVAGLDSDLDGTAGALGGGMPVLPLAAVAHMDDLNRVVARLASELERFNTLYVIKLERELTNTASRLSALESTVRAVADRALAWDNIQNHMAVWTDQSRTMERKLDILNRCHEKHVEWDSKLNAVDALNHKLTALDIKINAMTRLEFKVEQVSERVEEVDSKVTWLQKQQGSSPDGGGAWAEFASRGLLTTLTSIEDNVKNLSKSLSPTTSTTTHNTSHNTSSRARARVHGSRSRPVRHPHDSNRVQCDLDERDGRLLEDVSAKMDLVFDRLSDTEDYDNLISHFSRRSLSVPTARAPTSRASEHRLPSQLTEDRLSSDEKSSEDPEASDAVTERIFAMFWRSLFAPFKKLNRRFRALESHMTQLSRQCTDHERGPTDTTQPTLPARPPLTPSQLKLAVAEAIGPLQQIISANQLQAGDESKIVIELLRGIAQTVEASTFRFEEEAGNTRELIGNKNRDTLNAINSLLKIVEQRFCSPNNETLAEFVPGKESATYAALWTNAIDQTIERVNGRGDLPRPNRQSHLVKNIRRTSVATERDATALPPPQPTLLGCHTVSVNGIVRLPGASQTTPDEQAYFVRFCDQSLPGKGWTVIQRRGPPMGFTGHHDPLNFTRSWEEYKKGFGDLNGEFWWGNENIHRLSQEEDLTLRFDLWDFEGNHAVAEYDSFKLANESSAYRLSVSGYHGNASDSFSAHDNFRFSTHDRDNDMAPDCCPCAPAYGGGWWFFSCFESNLNGEYHKEPRANDYYRGLIWELWTGDYSLKATQMSVKPSRGDVPDSVVG